MMWGVLFGGAIAIVSAVVAQVVHRSVQIHQRRCSLAAALAGEIDALITIVELREFRRLVQLEDLGKAMRGSLSALSEQASWNLKSLSSWRTTTVNHNVEVELPGESQP